MTRRLLRSSARFTRNGFPGPIPTSRALGLPSDVITISSPAAARSRSSDNLAFAVRTEAIMQTL